jgi:hypothetical protein
MARVLAAAVLAMAFAGSPRAPEPSLDRVLFFATLEGLCEESLPPAAVEAVLRKDAEGRYVHFVYACPVCMPVLEGFRAYAMREKFYYSRKGDPLAGEEKDGTAFVKDPAAALHDFVGRCVERHVRSRRLTDAEQADLRQMLEEGRKKGMSVLESSKGFAHKSCPSCDGGTGTDWVTGR